MTNWTNWKSKSDNPNKLIHPSGTASASYEASGAIDAAHLFYTIPELRDKKSLEYGCGNARILRHLPTFDIYGVDIVPEFIQEARLYNDKCFLLDELPYNDFEVVFSYTVFIHLDDKQAHEALQYIYNHLLPTGVAYIQAPIYETHSLPRDFMDVRTWTVDSFFDLTDKIGFTIESLWTNLGEFSYNSIGVNHNRLHKLTKK
jgi:SAM-dependent methyltransferase